jgi:putative oxidoreductase
MIASWRTLFGPYLAMAFRVALGVIFIVAAWPKIAEPAKFAENIANYHLLPDDLINAMAICLPWIELICGAALVLGLNVRANLIVINAMLVVFIIAISMAIARGLDISCGCFSVATEKTQTMTRWTLYWDIIWLAMGVHAMIFYRPLLSLKKLLNVLGGRSEPVSNPPRDR